ncbi:MAG TPA: rhodanese-like domain-containing protein [Ktedonobacterales bacterium]
MSDGLAKADILGLLRFARECEDAMVESLTAAERDAIGTPENWAAKDYLANIMVWKQLQAGKLEALRHGETVSIWHDMAVIHQINSQAFTEHHSQSFEGVRAEGAKAQATLLAAVDHFSEEDLNDPQRFAALEGEPVRGETLGNGLWHPLREIASWYLRSGRREQVLTLQDAALARVRQARFPASSLGGVLYNQACLFATSGWPERALALLPEALRLRPTLVEWSKHDGDLDSLRDTPAFQAIFAEAECQAGVQRAPLVSPQEVRAEGADTLVIDVRGPSEFAAGHVAGAINIPLAQLAQQLATIARDRPVVTYCNMHHHGESRGERATVVLREHGFHARALDGGYPAWQACDFPVELAAH